MPCSALTPYSEMIKDNNLIDFHNETHTVLSRSSINSQASLDLMFFNDSNSSDEIKNDEVILNKINVLYYLKIFKRIFKIVLYSHV